MKNVTKNQLKHYEDFRRRVSKAQIFSPLIFLALFFSFSEDIHAQSWQWARAVGGTDNDAGSSVAIDPVTGDIYTTGHFTGTVDFDPGPGIFNLVSSGGEDIFILKLNNSGNFVWAKGIGGLGTDWGVSIAVDPTGSGNIYTTGFFLGVVDFDPGVGTYNLVPPQSYYFECLEAACSYYPDCDTLCQYFYPGAAMFISKLDASGNFVWAKSIGGINSAPSPYSIAIDPVNGGVYTTGYFQDTVDFNPDSLANFSITAIGFWDIFICKLNSDGNFRWAKSMGPPGILGGNEGFSIAIDPGGSGDVYSTGYFMGTTDFDPGPGIHNLTSAGCEDIYISKLDSAGTFIWAKAMGSACSFVSDNDHGLSIALDLEGNVYTTGFFKLIADFDPGPDVFNLTATGSLYNTFISKLDSEGGFVWAKSLGEGSGNSIAIDPTNGHVYTTGSFRGTVDFDPGPDTFNLYGNPEGESDIFISKLDSGGNFAWAQAIGGTNSEFGKSIVVDNSGNLYLTSFFVSPSISFDSTTLVNPVGVCWEEGYPHPCYNWEMFIAKLAGVPPCPSTVVITTIDGDTGSLRDIIYCAPNGSNITFDNALTGQTITLTSGEILINKNLIISGPGMLDLSVSGDNKFRVFNLWQGSNLELKNLSLKNATSGTHGGAILVQGMLELENILLQHNFENGIPKAMTIAPEGMVTIIGNVEIKN